MPKELAKHHNDAAMHHENAAKSHKAAATEHEAGNHEKGAHHATKLPAMPRTQRIQLKAPQKGTLKFTEINKRP